MIIAQTVNILDGEDAIIAEGKDGTQLKVAYDKQIGFGPEQALQILAIKGPSVVQTFLAMTALWLEKNTNAPYDKKLSASVTDILRMKGRKPTSGGGYRNEDIMHCGRDVYILMNTSVPISSEITYKNNRPIRQQTTISRLTQIEGMTIQQTLDPSELQSVIEFVYHLGKEIYEYLAGDHPQYALASSKILQYHPEREKYQIMLGFAILYYEKVNRKKNKALHQISLTSLLEMANIEVPQQNVQRFLDAITEAIEQLSQEQVIPGATVKKPAVIATKSAREILDKCHVSIPKLIDTENSEPQKSLPTPQ